MKFKHGDRVKRTIGGADIDDAKISIDTDRTPFICQNKKYGRDAEDKLGYEYSWALSKEFNNSGVTNLRPAKKSFDCPKIGDEYIDPNGGSRFVLGVAGRVIFLSSSTEREHYSYSYGMTKEQLIEYGYTIVQDEPKEEPTEMTLEEIEKLVGKKVKIVDNLVPMETGCVTKQTLKRENKKMRIKASDLF